MISVPEKSDTSKFINMALNAAIVALVIWLFQRVDEVSQAVSVSSAVVQRIEKQVEYAATDRYRATQAASDLAAIWRQINALEKEVADLQRRGHSHQPHPSMPRNND